MQHRSRTCITSKARLLPNMADQFCWTPMEASVWTSGIQTLPFLNCNFGIQNVPQELSNFVVWFGLDTVPRTYFDQMYRALLNGQAGEIHPAHLNFTHGERNFQFSPRSALLFFACQFSISRVQQADVNFDLLKWPVTLGFRVPRHFYESNGHVWNRWYFDYFVHFWINASLL